MNNSTPSYINRDEAPIRFQTLYWKSVEVKDLSSFVEEKPALSKPDIDVISASKLFKPDEVVLWIWKPNVFLLMPDDKGNHLRYAAKSCWRAPSNIERTRWTIQSGIFMILKWLKPEQIDSIRDTAKEHEWEKSRTCVNANAVVLNGAGITLWNWEPIDNVQLPITMFDNIDKHGLQMDWEPIEIETVKTTKKYLEEQVWETRKAVWFTLYRHAERLLKWTNKKRSKTTSKNKIDKKESKYINMKSEDFHKKDFDLEVSNVSKISVRLRLLWGPHTIFTLKQNRVNIDDYLNNNLTPYPDNNPSFFTKVKKNILFNNSVVGFINWFMQKGTSNYSGKSESDFYNMFETTCEENNNKYNIVVSSSWIMVAKIKVKNKVVDWLLSKHVLVSNYNEDVRFAWEAWKDEDWVIWVNNDSWTYKPSSESLNSFIKYINEIFPHIDIREEK